MRSSLSDDSTVSGDLTGRSWLTLRQALAEGNYTHVLILAGTNDLPRLGRPADSGGRTAEEVLADLGALHVAARAAGADTLAATVPQTTFEADALRYPAMARGRAVINEGVARLSRESGGHTLLADVAAVLPNVDVDGVRRQRWEPDGVHLTPAGYEELSHALFSALQAAGVTGCGGSGAAGAALLSSGRASLPLRSRALVDDVFRYQRDAL
jgi:lysophospholipase L1-like esterase